VPVWRERDYPRSLTSGSPSFRLRLTSTSSGYRYPSYSSATTSVTVANPLLLLPPLLTVTAAEPDYISVAGTYQWTAYPSGGVAPYSHRRDDARERHPPLPALPLRR
jgi:hypothetical protein